MKGPFSFTTTGTYQQVTADPSVIQVDVQISGPVTIRLYRGNFGQMVTVGEFDLEQSTNFQGATGIDVKTAGATAAAVTIICWQKDDPIPYPVPFGTTGVVTLTAGIRSMQQLTAGTVTYTPTAGTTAVLVEAVGGGGAGGGVQGTPAIAGGGGGGGGGYARAVLVSPLAASYPVTIGAGGTGVNGAGGNNGADTVFGSPAIVTANGGNGGVVNTGAGNVTGGAGGSGSGTPVPTFVVDGDPGAHGPLNDASGRGGDSVYGHGGREAINSGTGSAGGAFGGGGSGGFDAGASTNRTGGAGAAGVILVTEYA